MFLDFVATFPFDWVLGDFLYTRLIRLARLSKLMALLDIGRIKRLIKSYFENSTRADRTQVQQIVIHIYKMLRLIIVVLLLTYLIGCTWWFLATYINSDEDVLIGNTFKSKFELDELFDADPEPHEMCYRANCDPSNP